MANVRAPNLDFSTGVQPNRIPVSVAVTSVHTPVIVASVGACQRAPSSLNFALGVRPNHTTVSAPVAATSGDIIIFPSPYSVKPAPMLLVWGPTVGGGGGGTSSYPICG